MLADAVNDDDERTGGAANRDSRAAESGNQETSDNGGEDSGLGLYAGRNGESHRQGNGDDSDGDAGNQISKEGFRRIISERVHQFRAERN